MPELTVVAFGHSRAPYLENQAVTWLSLVMPAAIDPGPIVNMRLPYPMAWNPEVRGAGRWGAPLYNNFRHGWHGAGDPVAFLPVPAVTVPAPIPFDPMPVGCWRRATFFNDDFRHQTLLHLNSREMGRALLSRGAA